MEFIHFGFELFDAVVETIEFSHDAAWLSIKQCFSDWCLNQKTFGRRSDSDWVEFVAFHGFTSFSFHSSRSARMASFSDSNFSMR